MAFLFKSKKSQDRPLGSRDATTGSQGSNQSRRGDKGSAHRSTPTGSLNSLDNEGTPTSPDRGHSRRGGSIDQTTQIQQISSSSQMAQQQGQSDLPVGRLSSLIGSLDALRDPTC